MICIQCGKEFEKPVDTSMSEEIVQATGGEAHEDEGICGFLCGMRRMRGDPPDVQEPPGRRT